MGAKLHAGARERDAARDGLEMSESVTMGGGGSDDFRAALARREYGRSRKAEAKHQRLTELQSKESERMQKFKEEMGLQGVTQKIQIAPRQD